MFRFNLSSKQDLFREKSYNHTIKKQIYKMGLEYCHIKSIYRSPEQFALTLKGFHSPASLCRGLSIMRMHKGNLYQRERGPIYNTKHSLPERFIVILLKNIVILCLSLFIYLGGESAVGFALL